MEVKRTNNIDKDYNYYTLIVRFRTYKLSSNPLDISNIEIIYSGHLKKQSEIYFIENEIVYRRTTDSDHYTISLSYMNKDLDVLYKKENEMALTLREKVREHINMYSSILFDLESVFNELNFREKKLERILKKIDSGGKENK